MLKKPHYVALGSAGLLTLILLSLPGGSAARLKLAIGSLFLPLFGLASASQQLAGQATEAILPRGELHRQNQRLQRENLELRLQMMQAEEIRRENDRLRQLFAWQKQSLWKLKPARVVLREPANWWRTVHIDLGSRDGVRTNLPVLTPDGLVGRVASVSFARSEVVLLGDPNCKVSVLVQETRDMGVIASGAAGPLDTKMVEVNYLPASSALKPGQVVVTSGEGGVFPKGIRLGQIVDFRPVQFGLYNEARLKIAANLDALEEVLVLFP